MNSKQDQPLPAPRPGLHTPPPWVKIPLSNGRDFALIDVDDFAVVRRFNWHSQMIGGRYQYCACNIRKDEARSLGVAVKESAGQKGKVIEWTRISLHQFLMGRRPGYVIDHRNHDGLDCRRSNLRWATPAESNRYKRKRPGMTSRYLGVCWNKTKQRWTASIFRDSKIYHLGSFLSEEAAGRAFDARAKELGVADFTLLNFPHPEAQ